MNGDGEDRADDGEDREGGFVFGPERKPASESRAERSRDSDDAERRITVDLPDDDSGSASGPPERDPGVDPTGTGPDPGPNAVRNWTVLLIALALSSFATGAFAYGTQDDLAPVVGVVSLGVVFAALVPIALYGDRRLVEALAAAWAEHRRYTWFAAGLFGVGIVFGVLLMLAGINLLELIAELLEEELFPELEDEEFELTATFFIVNNTQPFVLSIAGALSLGLLTAFIMMFNGIVVGNVTAAIGGVVGIDYIVVGLAPHGVFELAALFIASGVGFRLLYRFGERVLGRRDAFLTKPYVLRTVAFVVFAWLLLVLAAFVEAYVTPELLELLFADRLEGLEEVDGPVTEP
ncbi:stage II sporulation protein M [Natrarchaeobius oligotrophus]|uniref:Stage II sporulation protein M n=1 Tax=Natrarchaeobius chitinivorans TaxID=1679083 RepID=A0A3N6PNT0_NATCH|nr:stage II sporulation protein M [Natrarchaeobius chitinivorans]RQH00766.1 stage II sporulation protein M [Natrarchaeobius chitinivorans]